MKGIPSYVQVVRNCWIMPTADLTAAVTAKKKPPARNALLIAIDQR